MRRDFFQIFPRKSIIGMIHLAGKNGEERDKRALEEVSIFEEEGLQGIIVEDYHGTPKDVVNTLVAIKDKGTKLVVGINVLRNPYSAFELADKYNAKFIQFDIIQTPDLNPKMYREEREKYPNVVVLGGVRFKYVRPTGKSLEEDIEEGMSRCEAIVTTGEGTGIETPTEKLRDFRIIMGDFPLVVGAGVNDENVREQLEISYGAIVGSYFKDGKTNKIVIRERVKTLMSRLREL